MGKTSIGQRALQALLAKAFTLALFRQDLSLFWGCNTGVRAAGGSVPGHARLAPAKPGSRRLSQRLWASQVGKVKLRPA